jgi:hypothetical protein
MLAPYTLFVAFDFETTVNYYESEFIFHTARFKQEFLVFTRRMKCTDAVAGHHREQSSAIPAAAIRILPIYKTQMMKLSCC